jgi:hypothetical protein
VGSSGESALVVFVPEAKNLVESFRDKYDPSASRGTRPNPGDTVLVRCLALKSNLSPVFSPQFTTRPGRVAMNTYRNLFLTVLILGAAGGLVSSAARAQSPWVNALRFAGTSGYVNVPDAAPLHVEDAVTTR